MPIDLNSVCQTPKYKGRYWDEVINNDPSYIKWMMENVAHFELSNEAYAQYLKACSVAGIEPWSTTHG